MKKTIVLVTITLTIFLCSSITLAKLPMQRVGDKSFSEKDFRTAYLYYYFSYLCGEITREEALPLIKNTRALANENDIETEYLGKSGNSQLPNIGIKFLMITEINNIYYDVFGIFIENFSSQKMVLNENETKFIAINGNSIQKNSLTIMDLEALGFPAAIKKDIVSDNKIFPSATANFMLIFPHQEEYKGIYIDAINYKDSTSETIYVDFFND